MRAGGLLTYFTRHRTVANILLIIMIAAGAASLPNMRAQFFPDVVVESVRLNVAWEGAGAEDVDRTIVDLMEPALLAVEGVQEISATSREGSANIRVEFEPGWDIARGNDEIQLAIDAIESRLPEGVDPPSVTRSTWRDRVTDVVITGPVGTDQLARFADEFVTRLYVEGVTRTTIRGVAAPEIVVEVPTAALLRHNVTLSEIARAIAAEADARPAGDVTGANARIRTGVEKRQADEVAEIVLRRSDEGAPLRIGDVAQIIDEGVDRDRVYFVAQNPAISIRVDRSAQGDAIGIQATVQEVADEMALSLPDGTQIDLIRTRAEAISGRINILISNGLMGLGLVVLLLFFFLNARTALWVAAGIPVAMGAAIGLMYLGGLTLNMISLFALLITLGIVVDDAIVVGEHADYRARVLGEDPYTAAANAAQRMFLPVVAATLTTIIAFFGLTAISGRFGTLIADIPFTVIAVLAASLVECFLILPNHMAHALAHSAKEHWYDWSSRQVNRGFSWIRETLFRPLMGIVIWARYPVIAGTIALLAWQGAAFVKGDVIWRFINFPERGSVSGNFAMLDGATREDSLEMMREMQRATEAVAARYEEEHGLSPILYVLAEVGGNSGRSLPSAADKDSDLLGGIAIELIDPDLRPDYSSFRFVADVQDEVRRHPMVEELSFRGWRSGPQGDGLAVEFYGADTAILKAAAEDLKTALAPFAEVSAVEDTLAYDKDEIILELTPRGEQLGFDIDLLARELRDRLSGIEAAQFPVGARTGTIQVALPEGEITADFIERTLLTSPTGALVPLADIVRSDTRSGFRSINRDNGIRVVAVTGELSEDDPARAAEITERLETEILPEIESRRQVASQLSGLAENERQFLSDALMGLILCLTGIYVVLTWIFSSWVRPLIVMAIIPFGLIGAIYGHAVWDVPFSMFSVVGLLGMTGIIINDSIVLVTTVDEYSAKERAIVPAIINAACDRLRPVLLTTLTTVLGLAPLLYESSTQAQFLRPTVITLSYGLGFGMVIVLLLVPTLLIVQRDIGRMLTALRRSAGLPTQSRRGRGLGAVLLGTGSLIAALFLATLGHALAYGGPWASFNWVSDDMIGAFVIFTLGSAVICLCAYVSAALYMGLKSKRAVAA